MRDYELTLIFQPDLTESKIAAIIKKLKIKVKTQDFWGKRFFAYPLKKYQEGNYLFLKVGLKSEEVAELEKKLRREEKVLRYLLVKS